MPFEKFDSNEAIEQRTHLDRRRETMRKRWKLRPVVDGLEQRLTLNGSMTGIAHPGTPVIADVQKHHGGGSTHKHTGGSTHKHTGGSTHKHTGGGKHHH